MVILFGLLGIGALAVVVVVIRVVSRRPFPETGFMEDNREAGHGGHRIGNEDDAGWPVSADRPSGASGRVRGTMQPLHAEGTDDVIVLDGYVVLEGASHLPAVLQGPATLALCQPAWTSSGAGAARLRLQEWIDDGIVLEVEVRHNGSRVLLDVRDETSTLQFDVASAR